MKKDRILGVGISFPGQVDAKRGIVVSSHIHGFENTGLKKIIEDKVNLPVSLENGASCLAIAEYKIGFNKRFGTFVAILADAGITSGIMIAGKLYKGVDVTPDFSHMIIESDGEKCACGNIGCLDAMSNGIAIEKRYKQLAKKTKSFEEIINLTKSDKKARQVLQEAGRYFGIGLTNAALLINPDLIIVSGQLTNAKEYFETAVKEMQKNTKNMQRKIQILKSTTEDAGILGASSIVM